MLVSFHEGYLLIVAACALFCLLSLIYSVINRYTEDFRERKLQQRVDAILQLLQKYPTTDGSVRAESKTQMYKMLGRPVGLLALVHAMDALKWDSWEKIPRDTRRMLCDVLSSRYVNTYSRAETVIQGVLIDLCIRCDASSSNLKRYLLRQLDSHDQILRTEALRCITAQMDRHLMVKALQAISDQPGGYPAKLLTDILMDYRGDSGLLMDALLPEIPHFSRDVQVSLLQVLSNLRDDRFSQQICGMMEDPKVDMEVRLAAIKYFGRVIVPEYLPRLVKFLKSETWEYVAVAAATLRNYDCRQIFDELLEGITSPNWYVRNNCAAAIVRNCSPEQVELALQSPDRFAKDSVSYALTEAKLNSEKGAV